MHMIEYKASLSARKRKYENGYTTDGPACGGSHVFPVGIAAVDKRERGSNTFTILWSFQSASIQNAFIYVELLLHLVAQFKAAVA